MKKTKFLTCLAALALLLAGCTFEDNTSSETGTESGTSTDTTETDTGGTTSESGTGEDSGSGNTSEGDEGETSTDTDTTPTEPPVTYTYSIEVENGNSLTLTYDSALTAQTGVELSIWLVTTPSTGTETKEKATTEDVTFTVVDPTVVTVSGLTVLPLAGGSTSITIAWSDKATTSVGVTVTDVTVPEPVGPTSWDEYITNDYDRGVIADFLGSVGLLDELLPFYLGDTEPTVTTGSSVSGQRLIITYNTATSTTLSTWVSLLEENGWEQTGHETSYNEIYTFVKDGYTVEVNLEFGSLYLYLYLPVAEPEPEPATSWDEFITNEAYRESIASLFGSVAALDEFLPFYGDTEPTSIVTGTHYSKGSRLVITYGSDILATWVSLLEGDGWTETDHQVTYEETYTFEKDGYTVDLELEFGTFYVYVYPKAVDTTLETAQAILDAAAAQSSTGYAGFDNLHLDGQCCESGYAGYTTTLTADLTVDENNYLYGRCQWVSSDEPGPRIRYYYNDNTKYYYDNMSSTGNHNYTASPQSNGTGERTINGILSTRLNSIGISSSNYDNAFANASSIDLASASDLALDTETNGNYKLTFIYDNIWYCYKADANLNLVGAGYSLDWTSATAFEIVYGEETTRAAIDEIMEADFFSVETWFPKESSEEEIASDILKVVQGSTPNWTAFYGYAEDDDWVATTEYLTTDSDGNLYGYKSEYDDWEETTTTSYYYGGSKCVYNYSGVAQTPGEVYTTYEEELEYFTYPLTASINLSTDTFELEELNGGGYELTITLSPSFVNTYTFTVDANYNLLSLDRNTLINPADGIESAHVEGITYNDVDAFIATTPFNPADFGFGGDTGGSGEQGGDEPAPEGLTLSDYISALTERGLSANCGDGFYCEYQYLNMGSEFQYDVYDIEATSDNYAYASKSSLGSSSTEYYTDGSATYSYDGTSSEKISDLYGFDYYKSEVAGFNSLILEQITSLGEDADFSDSDNAITDDYIYLYAAAADWSAYVEFYAFYDASGELTYFYYGYASNTESYTIEFYPSSSVTTPEWYVPETGAGEDNPLAAVAGSYTGSSSAGASLTLELNEDGTGTYDGNQAITWTLDGDKITFVVNYGDVVELTWDSDAQTLVGTYTDEYEEYVLNLTFTKDDSGDSQEETTNLVGTWTGSGTYSNTCTVTINTDGTYTLELPAATYTGTWTGSADGTIELDVSGTIFEEFTLTYDADKDTATVKFEDDDYNDYTVTYTRVG